MERLSARASMHIEDAFRPKTRRAYMQMFRVFVAFCIIIKVALPDVSVKVIMSFLECLVINKCSVSMTTNYLSAIKAKRVVYDLNFHVCEHSRVKYFVKSVKINRPLAAVYHNIFDIPMLKRMACKALPLPGGQVLKAIILTGIFAFLHLSNMCPHSSSAFDPSRHLTGHDLIFTKTFVKIMIKGPKRDAVQIITLPKL